MAEVKCEQGAAEWVYCRHCHAAWRGDVPRLPCPYCHFWITTEVIELDIVQAECSEALEDILTEVRRGRYFAAHEKSHVAVELLRRLDDWSHAIWHATKAAAERP